MRGLMPGLGTPILDLALRSGLALFPGRAG